MLRCLSSSWVSCRCGEKPQVETDSTHLGVLRRIGAGRCPNHCRSNHDFIIHRCESYDSLRTWSVVNAGVRSIISVWAYVGDAVIHEIAQLNEGQLPRILRVRHFFRHRIQLLRTSSCGNSHTFSDFPIPHTCSSYGIGLRLRHGISPIGYRAVLGCLRPRTPVIHSETPEAASIGKKLAY